MLAHIAGRPFASRPTRSHPHASAPGPWSEVIQFPAPHPGKDEGHWLVYLTWNKTAFGPRIHAGPGRPPTRGNQRF